MNVLHVVDSLERGGLERVVTDIAIAQRRRGDGAAVFSLNPTGGFAHELLAAGVPVILGGKTRGFDLKVARALRRCVNELGIQVVHAHNFVPNYYSAVALWGLRRALLVGTCHDMGQRLANRRLCTVWRWSLRHTRGLAMVGQQVFDRYVGSGLVPASKAAVVLNAIPLERFPLHGAQRLQARAALGLPADAPVIGCVGRLVALKNHRIVLEVLPAMLRQWPDLRFALIGSGALEPALRAQAESLGVSGQVVFAGARADVAQLLPALDVFLLPSLTEGLSIALLEAAAAALPIVATAVGGNPEIVRHGETGLLVPPADGVALREAVSELLADPQARQALGRRAREWVERNASIDALCGAYDAFYRRCGAKV